MIVIWLQSKRHQNDPFLECAVRAVEVDGLCIVVTIWQYIGIDGLEALLQENHQEM